jgi:hypothetical protein
MGMTKPTDTESLDPQALQAIGEALVATFRSVAAEPVPDHLLKLLAQLELKGPGSIADSASEPVAAEKISTLPDV